LDNQRDKGYFTKFSPFGRTTMALELAVCQGRLDLAFNDECPRLAIMDPGIWKASSFGFHLIAAAVFTRKTLLINLKPLRRRSVLTRSPLYKLSKQPRIRTETRNEGMRESIFWLGILVKNIAHESYESIFAEAFRQKPALSVM
jgi:hypothetical protein